MHQSEADRLSSNLASHRNSATIAMQELLWSPLFYCTLFSHIENLLDNVGLCENELFHA